MKITVIGIGLQEGDLTARGETAIKKADFVIARTNKTASYNYVKNLRKDIISLDGVYEKSRNYDTLNKNLAKEILLKSKQGNVAYLVDGAPQEDNSVKELIKKDKNLEIISGVSITLFAMEKFKISSANLTYASAYELNSYYGFNPLIVYAIDSKITATAVKLKLMETVGEDTPIRFYNGEVKILPLYELDRFNFYNYSTCIYIDKVELTKKTRFNFYDLIEILKRLRGENGCPWDKQQTPKSITSNLIEEAYELVDAVNSEDEFSIIEETGDVLLQCAFYMQFGEESKAYTANDIISDICYKLISRHTHVFGEDSASNSLKALEIWNKNKQVEKGYKSATDYLKGVPVTFPAVMRAQKISNRASKYNLTFTSNEELILKCQEELNEVKVALQGGNFEEITKECGDLLFAVSSFLKFNKVDGELALNKSVNEFIKRFEKLESLVIADNKDISKLTTCEIESYYQKAKSVLKNGN